MEMYNDDITLNALIDYCPESPVDLEDNCSPPPAIEDTNEVAPESEPPPRIILVCTLCYRQYDLEEDLRGHLMEYHKYVPIEKEKKSIVKFEAKESNEEQPETEHKELVPEKTLRVVLNEPQETFEIKPAPFKDFRLILRREMNLKCTNAACAYKFQTDEKLQNHLKCHLSNMTSFKCYLCSMALNNWRRCSAHLWKAHKTDVDLLQCPICEFKSHASALVWRHMRVHKKWRPRVLRSLKAVKLKRLQEAQLKLEEDKPKPIVRKNRYYSEKTCEICDRKFVNGKTLSKHVKTVHNKIKPFNCNVCGKKTARKASLIIHMRQHTGEKPLHCKTCKFSTRDPSVLHKHQMRHDKSAVKLKCPICDYSFIQSTAYKKHMRLNHAESYKKISCDLCSFVTVNEEKLKAHKVDHRKGLIRNTDESMSTRKVHKNNEASTDCFLPLESIDSLPHEPAVDTGGVTIPAPSEDSQFPTLFSNN